MKRPGILLVTALTACNLYGADEEPAKGIIDAKQIYIGGGVSLNDIDFGDDSIGFQVFAGLPIPVEMGEASLSGELGYMDSGNFDQIGPFAVSISAQGIWANAVVTVPLPGQIDLIGRAGYDFGDDDGIMIGGGIEIPVNEKMDLRFEYVVRDSIDSLQANIVIRQ